MPKDGYAPAIGGTGVGPGPAVPFGRRERQPSSSGHTPTAAEGGSAAVKAAAYSSAGRGRRLAPTVVSAVIPGVVQHAAGVAPRMRSLLEEDLAVDHGVVDPLGQLPHPPAVVRAVVLPVSRDPLHGVGIDDHQV